MSQIEFINPQIFETSVEMKSARAGFGEGLVQAGQENKDVVALCANVEESIQMTKFKEKFPQRYFEVGIAEQNLATVASGMASMGKIPFIGSYAIFSPGRNWEQIRTTICLNNQPVKIVGSHAGLNVGADGATHQALEDIALMRVLPRMTVISPCDAIEAKKATLAMAKTLTPAYIRLAREKTPILTTEESPFEIGKAQIVFKSDNKSLSVKSSLKNIITQTQYDVGIIATGILLYQALLAAQKLEQEGKRVVVMNISTIKPLDGDAVIKLAHQTGAIVTVEEHQIAGGLGSVVAECLSSHYPIPMEFIGVRDLFGQSGTMEELFKHYFLDTKSIYEACRRVIVRK